MDDGGCLGYIIIGVIAIVVIGFLIYIAAILASVIAGIAGAGGLAWGGGTAVVNYAKSFKENMIDSNRATAWLLLNSFKDLGVT